MQEEAEAGLLHHLGPAEAGHLAEALVGEDDGAILDVVNHQERPVCGTRTGPIRGQTIRGQTIRSQTIRGQTIRGQTIRGQTIRGQTIRGQTVRGQTVRGQTIRGQKG